MEEVEGQEVAMADGDDDLIYSESVETFGVHRGQRIKNLNAFGGIKVKDHFSLSNPSSTVQFSDKEAIVFVDNTQQLVLQKGEDDDFFVARHVSTGTPGLFLIRAAYTLVTVLMTGVLFVFCIQVVLFLFLGLAIETGLTSQGSFNTFAVIGTIFAIPIFLQGMSQTMTFANTFCIDTWKGSKFIKTVFSWDSVLVDWISVFVFICLPLVVGCIALLSGTKYWWDITSMVWISSIFIYFIIFSCCAVFYEIDGCLELIRFHPKLRDGCNPDMNEYNSTTFKRAVLLRQRQKYGGYKYVAYTRTGVDPYPENLSYSEVKSQNSFKTIKGLMARFSQLPCMSRFFYKLDEPKRQYSIDAICDATPYVTDSSWGLESIFCRNRDTRSIAIIDGASALTKSQVMSSFYCFFFGITITLFALICLLAWFQAPILFIIVAIFLYILAVYRKSRSSYGMRELYKQVITRNDGKYRSVHRNRRSEAIYQVQETFRVTEPTELLCWAMLVIETLFFFVLPVIALLVARNWRVAALFIVMGILTQFRKYLSAPAVLEELGSLEGIEINNDDVDPRSAWREKHRLADIVTNISIGKRSQFWTGVFLVFILVFCVIFIAAITITEKDLQDETIDFADATDFYYGGSGSLDYATCSISKSLVGPDTTESTMVDFAYLTSIVNLSDDSVQNALDSWFGSNVAENDSDIVNEFRTVYQEANGKSAVTYKLFRFPNNNLDIVSIRGTNNAWDALTDAQLWSSAALAQYIKGILPIGELWTPILPFLVKAVSIIEDKTLKEVSYYRETTKFVQSLKEVNKSEGNDRSIEITGHSLGGGLAMITGAQEKIPAIALSGPNNKISRFTFDPQLTIDDLDQYTFNIVPDRDPVPRIDDLSRNYQRIRCKAAPNAPIDCHFGNRSLCEILYTCGSDYGENRRPIPCFCVHKYGYDAPTSRNGEAFETSCPKP